MSSAAALRAHIESSLSERLASTLALRERAAPPTAPTGVAALDELTGGLPRGALSEIVGAASSGRTSVMLTTLAQATGRGEICALVDASDGFDPASAVNAGVDLNRLLWVRCNEPSETPKRKTPSRQQEWKSSATQGFVSKGRLEQVLKVTDLLLQGGGFGMVVLDMGDIPAASIRRIPLTSWFRFRRAVEPTATVLLVIEEQPSATTCASLVVRLEQKLLCLRDAQSLSELSSQVSRRSQEPQNAVSHASLLCGAGFRAEVVRTWMRRKPPHSVGVPIHLHTCWQ